MLLLYNVEGNFQSPHLLPCKNTRSGEECKGKMTRCTPGMVRISLHFRGLVFLRHVFTWCSEKEPRCTKDIICLDNRRRLCRSLKLKFATKLLLKVKIFAVSKFLKSPPLLLWFCIVVPSFPWRALLTCAVVIQLCRFEIPLTKAEPANNGLRFAIFFVIYNSHTCRIYKSLICYLQSKLLRFISRTFAQKM